MPCPSTGSSRKQGRKISLALTSNIIFRSKTDISLKLIKFISLQYCHNVTLCLPRRLFKEPEVTPASDVELKWEKPDEEELVNFMVTEKGFSVRKL